MTLGPKLKVISYWCAVLSNKDKYVLFERQDFFG